MRFRNRGAAKSRDIMKLYRPGRTFLVKSLDYNNRASKQLIDMGITPDTIIYIDSAAPLGEPLVVKVRDYKVALRSKDLTALEVEQQNDISPINGNTVRTL
jgi:ferrous iron transport protein A